jgi:hypothetical protein
MSDEGWMQREYYRACLLCENHFQQFDRLGCEYMCDMFSRMEDQCLEFIRQAKEAEAMHFQSRMLRDYSM